MNTRIRIALCCLLIGGGLFLQTHPEAVESVRGGVGYVVEWFGYDTTAAKWYIVEETKDRSKLHKEEISVLAKASSYGVIVIDKDVVGADKKTPSELVPVISAAWEEGLPQLVKVTTSGRCYCYPLPNSISALKTKIGAK